MAGLYGSSNVVVVGGFKKKMLCLFTHLKAEQVVIWLKGHQIYQFQTKKIPIGC